MGNIPQREMTLEEWVDGLPDGHLARKELAQLEAALNYYKTGAQQTSRNCIKPKYVPKRIVLSKTIRSDMPSSDLCAEPREYVAHCNQYGAVSLRTLGGEMLGVKLDEFEVIEWQENPALLTGEQDETE